MFEFLTLLWRQTLLLLIQLEKEALTRGRTGHFSLISIARGRQQ